VTVSRPRAGRVLFGFALVIAWAGQMHLMLRVGKGPIASESLLGALAGPAGVTFLSVAFLSSLAAFVLKFREATAGLCAFGVLWLAAAVEASLFTVSQAIHHNKLLPVGCLAGYLLGLLVTQNLEEHQREQVAWHAACGVAGAIYAISAYSKLDQSGASWFQARTLGLLIGERQDAMVEVFSLVRRYVVARPALCSGLAVFAVFVEMLGVVFVDPRFRRPYALLTVGLHLGILALLGYFYPAWMVMMPVLAFLPPADEPRPAAGGVPSVGEPQGGEQPT